MFFGRKKKTAGLTWTPDLQNQKNRFVIENRLFLTLERTSLKNQNYSSVSKEASDEFTNHAVDVDRVFVGIRYNEEGSRPDYQDAAEMSASMRKFGVIEKFLNFSIPERREIYLTCKDIDDSFLSTYILALCAAGSPNGLIMTKREDPLFAGAGMSLPDRRMNFVETVEFKNVMSRVPYLRKLSGTFRIAAERFAKDNLRMPSTPSNDMAFTVACLMGLAYGESLIMRLMDRWLQETDDRSLIKFIKIAETFENQEDFPIGWLVELTSDVEEELTTATV